MQKKLICDVLRKSLLSLSIFTSSLLFGTEPVVHLTLDHDLSLSDYEISVQLGQVQHLPMHERSKLILLGIRSLVDHESELQKELIFEAIRHANSLSLEDYHSFFTEIINGIAAIANIPNPSPEILVRREDLKILSREILNRLPKEDRTKILELIIQNQSEPAFIITIFSNDPCTLKFVLNQFNSRTSNKEDIKDKYINLIPKLKIDSIKAVYEILNSDAKETFLEAMYVFYLDNHLLREYILEILPNCSEKIYHSLAKVCINNRDNRFLNVVLSLVDPHSREKLMNQLKKFDYYYTQPLPGRVGSNQVYRATFGGTDVYFNMSLEKLNSVCELVENINNDVILSIDSSMLPKNKITILPQIYKYCKPLGYDKCRKPIYSDERGREVFEKYLISGCQNLKNNYSINLKSSHVDLYLGLNNDSNKWTRNHIATVENDSEYSHPLVVQELTLTDWQMPRGVIAGTLFQDGAEGDRFLMVLHHRDTFNMLITHQKELENTFPYQAFLSPIDYESHMTSGSTKGKHLVSMLKGIASMNEFALLREKSIDLKINRVINCENEKKYANGIIIKNLVKSLSQESSSLRWLGANENTDIFDSNPFENKQLVSALANLIGIKDYTIDEVRIYHLIKRTPGLSRISNMNLEISEGSIIVLLNRSTLPEGYDYYNIAEDQTDQNLPWIQFYRILPNTIMMMNKQNLSRLALSPIEELIYEGIQRTPLKENNSDLMKKIVTHIELYIFPPQ